MADSQKKKAAPDTVGAPAVSDADDGGQSRLTAGYKDNPDKPDPDTVAQIEVLSE